MSESNGHAVTEASLACLMVKGDAHSQANASQVMAGRNSQKPDQESSCTPANVVRVVAQAGHEHHHAMGLDIVGGLQFAISHEASLSRPILWSRLPVACNRRGRGCTPIQFGHASEQKKGKAPWETAHAWVVAKNVVKQHPLISQNGMELER